MFMCLKYKKKSIIPNFFTSNFPTLYDCCKKDFNEFILKL